jgi:hypothetical protein
MAGEVSGWLMDMADVVQLIDDARKTSGSPH